MSRPDLAGRRRVHLVGIGGAGMSAIATVLAGMGHVVTGSDLKQSAGLERLRGLGVGAVTGHDAANVEGSDFVVVSSAVGPSNVEVVAARQAGIPIFRRADVLAAICASRRTIAVSGTHGKTTTTSMLAAALVAGGLAPSFIVGGEINEIGTNAAWDEGEWLVVEADESDGTFLELSAEIAVVTNVEPDHLDHYGSFAALQAAFGRFLAGAGTAVVSADDPVAAALSPAGATSFGFVGGADFCLEEFVPARSSSRSTIRHDGRRFELVLSVPGRHNALNAAAALAAASLAGVDDETTCRALCRFGGVARRFEVRGEFEGATLVDDYAHLPAEVVATLATARAGGWRRVVCVFQPHRYSRVAALADAFADAFVDADVLFVTDIYGAGEEPRPGVSSERLLEAVRRSHPDAFCAFVADREALVAELRATLKAGDCCCLLGAGDLPLVTDELLSDRSVRR